MDLKKFESPSALYRPAPFWSWNDKLDGKELIRQIREMADKGWGSYFMHSRVGLVTDYLSEEWMELIRQCAEEGRNTGTYAWLYDEDKWPSGFAGGEVPRMSETYRSRALVLIDKDKITKNETVLFETNLDGKPIVICKRILPLGDPGFNGASYVDLMNTEAVQAFINCTHERYKAKCGEYFGKEIPGIFTDEPCYLIEGQHPEPVLPWSECLPEYFRSIKGYMIEEKLEQLFFDIGDYRKVRFDFFDCATRLFMESFTKKYYHWCSENHLIMTGHFMAEDDLTYQTQWIGAAMPHYQFMHWPGVDKLGRNIEQLVTVKQVTSAVEQLNKERAFCEAFGCVGQQVSFFHRKWICDWQAVLGINFVNSHLSLYSMRGERKRDYPANLFYQQPWWDNEKQFADYVARLSYAVSEGKREVDILVIHPISSVWSEYSPLHKESGLLLENGFYHKLFEQTSKELIANKLDFHYGDEIIMESHAKVEKGKLVVGSYKYSTVIVPPSCTLRKNTIELLEKFADEAGNERLIFVQKVPELIEGAQSDMAVVHKAMKVPNISSMIQLLDQYYMDRIRISDLETGTNAAKVIYHTRKVEQGRLVILANTDDKREISTEISIRGAVKPKVLDLMSGEVFSIPYRIVGDISHISVTFYPAGSLLLLISDEEGEYRPVPNVLDSGITFREAKQCLSFITNWEMKVMEENVLPINDITLYLAGKKALENSPVAKAWHEHFYKAEDGTDFTAKYSFEVLQIPEGPVAAVIEVAENLDRILINGTLVKPLKEKGELGELEEAKSWKDPNFTRVPLNGMLRKGRNTLEIAGKKVNNIIGPGLHKRVSNFKKYMPTELESIYIIGNFKVSDMNREIFMIGDEGLVNNTTNLTSAGYPFYAGKAEYNATMGDIDKCKEIFLKIDGVNAACLELYINDQSVGIKFWEPFIFDVTGLLNQGINRIKVVVSTTLFNLMGPNRITDIADNDWVSPRTFIDLEHSKKQYTLLPFGIKNAVIIG